MNTRMALILNSAPGSVEQRKDGTIGRFRDHDRWWACWEDGVPLRGSLDGTEADGTTLFLSREDAVAALVAGREEAGDVPETPDQAARAVRLAHRLVMTYQLTDQLLPSSATPETDAVAGARFVAERLIVLDGEHTELTRRVAAAIELALDDGCIDGSHHKMWVIDQVIRLLTGSEYETVIAAACKGHDGTETLTWDTGTPP